MTQFFPGAGSVAGRTIPLTLEQEMLAANPGLVPFDDSLSPGAGSVAGRTIPVNTAAQQSQALPPLALPGGVQSPLAQSGVRQPGSGNLEMFEGSRTVGPVMGAQDMPEYDEAGNYLQYRQADVATVGMAMVPAAQMIGRSVVGPAATALGSLAGWLIGAGRSALPWFGAGTVAESLLPGDVLPFTPSITEIAETVGDWAGVALDLAPGGMVPGERKTRERLLQSLSAQTGIQITALTQLPQGGWMGSYLPSPGAKKKRGFYIGPGGFPIKTWANRGNIVISRDPRGSTVAKAARALDKTVSRYVKAERITSKVARKVRRKKR